MSRTIDICNICIMDTCIMDTCTKLLVQNMLCTVFFYRNTTYISEANTGWKHFVEHRTQDESGCAVNKRWNISDARRRTKHTWWSAWREQIIKNIDQSNHKCTKRGLFLTIALLNVTLVKVLLRVRLRMFSWKLSDLLHHHFVAIHWAWT